MACSCKELDDTCVRRDDRVPLSEIWSGKRPGARFRSKEKIKSKTDKLFVLVQAYIARTVLSGAKESRLKEDGQRAAHVLQRVLDGIHE